MSNAAIIPITKTYPVFEPNQVLSDDHLNDLRTYFDSEILSTRNQLIGTGIVNGLHFQTGPGSISITRGAGISTDGYLISSEPELQEYRDVIDYKFADEEDALRMLVLDSLTDGLRTINDEERRYFLDASNQRQDLVVAFYELIVGDDPRRNTDPTHQAINASLYSSGESCIALYLETTDIDVESCFTTNCDERGIERIQTIRPLLIVSNRPAKAKSTFTRPAIPPVPRIHIEHSNAPDLANSFAVACNDGMLDELQNIINRVDTYLGRILGSNENRPPQSLKNTKAQLLASDPHYIPCFYEHVKDIGSALNDLLDAAEGIDYFTRQIPDTYAEYLMLGPLKSDSERFARTEFLPAQPVDEASPRLEEIEYYWQRLHHMLDSFAPSAQSGIKITPGHITTFHLQDQSMPFFYSKLGDAPLYEFWNQDLYELGKAEQVLSYFSDQYGNQRQFTNPLEYCHEGKDLLLIEDCIGHQKSDALDQLQLLKKQHHLAFGLVALRVSSADHDAPYVQPSMSDPIYYIREDNFKSFIEENPGLYHARGIRKDWSLVLVFEAEPDDTDGPVVAVLALPYICCGQPAAPAPFVLDAHDDEHSAVANAVTDIDVLHNDEFDPHSPVELDLIEDFTLDARDEEVAAKAEAVTEIDALDNDLYDSHSHIEVDLVTELDANDVEAHAMANESIDIDVLENDTTDPGEIDLDFADQP